MLSRLPVLSSSGFMPHGFCIRWIPELLWLHVLSDLLIGLAYIGISITLGLFVRRIRLPFSPVFIAFGLFIALCGGTHFMEVWTIWQPFYWASGMVKAATAAASVATALGLVYLRPQIEALAHTTRLSEARRERLESTNAELKVLYARVKELDELKSQFFANVSHELRTPLALMLGPAEQLLQDQSLAEPQRRRLASIARNGKTLLKQVNDLLDVARLDEARLQPRYARFDAAIRAGQIASRFELVAEQRALTFRLMTPGPILVEADPEMLERILVNLLSNAFKFTPDQGVVRVQLGSEAGMLSLTVADSGPGVRADHRQLIFERFRQSDGGLLRQYGGTGLGLAIVRALVELHRGQVEVSDAPEGGALFLVRLPLRAPPGEVIGEESQALRRADGALAPAVEVALEGVLNELAAPRQADPDDTGLPKPGAAQVLLVEDNAEMRAFVAGVLGSEYQVLISNDGMEGLMKAQALRPDLIVTDVMMPHMSGEQLVAALQADPDLKAIPILLLSAKADEASRVRLLGQGASDYLTKPFSTAELLARAGNLVTAKRAADTLRQELASRSTDLEVLAREIAAQKRQMQLARDSAEVARDHAEHASGVKTYFLGLISHELRTPLSVLNMNLQLLANDRRSALPESAQPRLQRSVLAARQMTSLIEGLLEYTRAESGRIQPTLALVDPVLLAAELVDIHAGMAAPQIRVSLEADAASRSMLTDARLLRVVLDNLLSNAMKFTREGRVLLRLTCRGDDHIFELKDSGIGIPADAISRIFLPFEQIEPLRRKSAPGVGLGLTLVKHIVDALGGNMEVTSEVGVGSVFSVTLPGQPGIGAHGRAKPSEPV